MTSSRIPLAAVLALADRDGVVEPHVSYPMMGVRSFGRGAFAAAQMQGADTSYATLRRVRAGDVVYPKLMAWEGAFAVVPDELSDRWVSPEFCVFQADTSAVSERYLAHLISWEGFREGLLSGSTGTNARRRRLNPQDFLAHVILLPEIDEQRHIAAHLDSLAPIAKSFVRSTGDADASWRAITEIGFSHLRDAPTMQIGKILQLRRRAVSIDASAVYQEIGVRSFGRGIFVKPPVGGADIGTKRVFAIDAHDLVVSNVFAWEGAVAVAGTDHQGLIGSHRFMTWSPVDSAEVDVDVDYLGLYLLSKEGLDKLQRASPGSAGRNRTLSIRNFEAIEVPLPCLREQQRLATIFGDTRRIAMVAKRRQDLVDALLPAARNEIFSAMR